MFTIAYYGQESTVLAARIKKLCKKYLTHIDIRFAFRKQHTLKSIFLPIIKGRGLGRYYEKFVYRILCANREKAYIGETNRNRYVRMKERQANIRKHESSSVLTRHTEREKHTFDFNNIRTLSRESN